MRMQNAAARPFDISQVEGDIREAVHQRPPHVVVPPPRTPAPPVPEYVSHRDDVTEIGRLSAEAIVREYAPREDLVSLIEGFVRRFTGL